VLLATWPVFVLVAISQMLVSAAEIEYSPTVSSEQWRERLASRDERTRFHAASALSQYPEKARESLPELVVALSDASGSVRAMAVLALKNIGMDALPAEKSLVDGANQKGSTCANEKGATEYANQVRGLFLFQVACSCMLF
jgi:hypothetical protein